MRHPPTYSGCGPSPIWYIISTKAASGADTARENMVLQAPAAIEANGARRKKHQDR